MSAEIWSLTDQALRGEPWRLWTAHLVHYDWRHLAANLLALAPLAVLVPRRFLFVLLASALVIAPLLSVGILLTSEYSEYRGASGLLVGLYLFAGACITYHSTGSRRRMAAALLSLLLVKLALETSSLSLHFTSGDWSPAVEAHLLGAAIGVIFAAVFIAATTRLSEDSEETSITRPFLVRLSS